MLFRSRDEADRENPNAVKVVLGQNGDALYFSRSPIPYPRSTPRVPVYEHIGIYGYRSDFLRRYVELPMTPLAEAESCALLPCKGSPSRPCRTPR